MKPTVAYISQRLPNLTETFVYREIFALREQGFKVVPLSIHAPSVKQLPGEARALAEETHYVFPLNRHRFLTAHAYFLLTQLDKYLQTFLFVMTRPEQKPSVRRRTLYHFGEAIYLAAHVQRQGVQHVHAHFSVNAATIALVMSRMLDISFSFTVHNNIFTDQLILKEKIREAKFIAVISEYSRDFLLNMMADEPHLKDKFRIIHCGVSLEQFQPISEEARAPADKPLIFSVGQFAERKGMPVLVEACRILRDRGHKFECVIAGDGAERELLERMITDNRLQDVVKLTGVIFQDEVRDYLNRTDIFAMPCITAKNGDKDGIPVVFMEAMAMEIPVVSTYVSGIPELIDHTKNGLLVTEKDAFSFADALQQLLEDETLRRKFGRDGRQKVMADFNIDKTSVQMASLFGHH
jgi:glycosyltransferase involved in cell wall biosynthesis